MISMTSVMQNYGLLWTDPDGTPQASAGRYDKRSAKHRRTELKAVGCTHVEIVPVRPGERVEQPLTIPRSNRPRSASSWCPGAVFVINRGRSDLG